MQIQFESEILEPKLVNSTNFAAYKTATRQADGSNIIDNYSLKCLNKLHAVKLSAWSSASNVLAVYLSKQNQICLIQTKKHPSAQHQKVTKIDKFLLQSADKKFARNSFQLTCMSFSLDGTKLAVGQTDCVIYVYKLFQNNQPTSQQQLQNQQLISQQQLSPNKSANQNDFLALKPTICAKFVFSSPITCLIWTKIGIIFCTQDTKVRLTYAPQQQTLDLQQQSNQFQIAPRSAQSSNVSGKVCHFLNNMTKLSSMPICVSFLNKFHGQSSLFAVGCVDGTVFLSQQTLTGLNFASQIAAESQQQLDHHQQQHTFSDFGATTSNLIKRRGSSTSQFLANCVINLKSPPIAISLIQGTFLACATSGASLLIFSISAPSDNSKQTPFSSSPKTNQFNDSAQNQQLKFNLIKQFEFQDEIVSIDYSAVNEVLICATSFKIFFIKTDSSAPQQQQTNITATTRQNSPLQHQKQQQQKIFDGWQLYSANIELGKYPICAILWAPDGSQLVACSARGAIELFSCDWNQSSSISGKLDICHLAKNRIRISDSGRNLISIYKTNFDIKRINFFDDCKFVAIWTTQSLLFARVGVPNHQAEINLQQLQSTTTKTSNILENISSAETSKPKFYFENFNFVLISVNSQLLVVQFGHNKVILRLKLQVCDKNLISVRQFGGANFNESINEPILVNTTAKTIETVADSEQFATADKRPSTGSSTSLQFSISNIEKLRNLTAVRVAYVHDDNKTTLSVIQLVNDTTTTGAQIQTPIYTYSHIRQIIWLQLSSCGESLAFQDSAHCLFCIPKIRAIDKNAIKLYDNHNKNSVELLDNCHFAQWLIEARILIAQSGSKILVYRPSSSFDNCSLRNSATLFNAHNGRQISAKNQTNVVEYFDQAHDFGLVESVSRIKNACASRILLVLTNGLRIELGDITSDFNEALEESNFDVLLQIVRSIQASSEAETPTITNQCKHYWQKLATKAIENGRLDIALEAFDKLKLNAKAKCVAKCIELRNKTLNSTNKNKNQVGDETTADQRENNDNDDGDDEDDDDDESWALALLQKDWTKFEANAKQGSKVASIYKRLNRWEDAIKYLNKTSQFRARDLCEQEFIEWLLARNQMMHVARLKAKSGKLLEAIQILLDKKMFREAADLLINSNYKVVVGLGASNNTSQAQKRLDNLTRELCKKLIEQQMFSSAAQVSEKVLNEKNVALDLYLKGNEFSCAIQLARIEAPERVAELEEKFGEHLFDKLVLIKAQREASQQQSTLADFPEQTTQNSKVLPDDNFDYSQKIGEAIEHLLEAGKTRRALEVSIELGDFVRAAQILPSIELRELHLSDELRDYCKTIGDYFANEKHFDQAIKFYLLGQHFDCAIDTRVENNEFEAALEGAKSFGETFENKTREKLKHLAKSLATIKKENNNNLIQAERIFLLVDMIDDAIEMYKNAQMHDAVLRLVAEYRPDQLEKTLLVLARQFEAQGKFELVEKYLLNSLPREWSSVVNMYKLANRCQDAWRVAQKFAQDDTSLMTQLAYDWSKSLNSVQKSVELLKELQMFDQVVSYCVECKNFELALELIDNSVHLLSSGSKRDDLHKKSCETRRKYAEWLEAHHKFDKAEQILISANQLEDAIQMYVDNEMFEDAIRVVDDQLQTLNNVIKDSNINGSDEKVTISRLKQELDKLLNETLLKCANQLATNLISSNSQKKSSSSKVKSRKFDIQIESAKQMFLRAQQPQLAIEMLQSLQMWQDAIQVAQRFAPKLLAKVEESFDAQIETSDWNSLRPINGIDTNHHQQKQQHFNLRDELGIADANSALATITTTTQQLQQTNNVSEDINDQIIFEQILKARNSISTRDAFSAFFEIVTQRFLSSYQKDITKLLDNKRRFVEQLDKLLDEQMLSFNFDEQIDESFLLKFLHLFDANALSSHLPITDLNFDGELEIKIWKHLRNLTLEIYDSNQRLQPTTESTTEANNYANKTSKINNNNNNNLLLNYSCEIEVRLFLSHYVVLQATLAKQVRANVSNWPKVKISSSADLSRLNLLQSAKNVPFIELAAKLSNSLLRFANILPLNTSLYSAGVWLSAANKKDAAFVMWSKLIELLDSGKLDETFALQCNIPTTKVSSFKVSKDSLSESQVGAVRSWLLQALIEHSFRTTLPLDERKLFESALFDTSSTQSPSSSQCLVSGYPVLDKAEEVVLNEARSKFKARRSAWTLLCRLALQVKPINDIAQFIAAGICKSMVK